MGYVAKSLLAPTLKTAVIMALPSFIYRTKQSPSTAYTEVYKQTLNLTNIDYIEMTWTSSVDGGAAGTFQCLFDAVSKFETSSNAGNIEHETIDCTALTGEVALILQCKNSNTAQSHFTMLTIYCREA